VITGELRSKVDRVWDAFWSGGVSNPLQVIEQITYLLFIRRLDDLHTRAESRARALGQPIEGGIFPEGDDAQARPWSDLRWSKFREMDPARMYDVVDGRVFPFLRELGGDGSTYAHHMRDARFGIPTPALLAKVVDMVAHIPMDRRDTNGDLYEYMLSKLSTSGTNGQFRTPRHLIELMVTMTAPKPDDVIVDPACGSAGFLVAAEEWVREQHPESQRDPKLREHFHHGMFHGFDFDSTMLRIGSMNMQMHGVENSDIRYRDSLSEAAGHDEGAYSLILANPPFAGSLDYESVSTDLLRTVKTKKTELLFLALFLRLLKPGGRAAVIVPDGVLFGSSKAHKTLRRSLVEEHQLEGVVKLPSGAFKPYAGVSTAILFFTKTGVGGTDEVWFYDVQADGLSLDDKRQPLLDAGQLGAMPAEAFVVANHAKNNLPDVVSRWGQRTASERHRARTEQSFTVPLAEIVENDYDLSINRYKEIVHEDVAHDPPEVILAELEAVDAEIRDGLEKLKVMLRG
jgi:type I restriction enzyme M protein